MMCIYNMIDLARLLRCTQEQDHSGEIMNRKLVGVALLAAAAVVSVQPARADFAVLIQQSQLGPHAFVEDCNVTLVDADDFGAGGLGQSYGSSSVTQLPSGDWLCSYELDGNISTEYGYITVINPTINCFMQYPEASEAGNPLAQYNLGPVPAPYVLDLNVFEPCDDIPEHYGFDLTIPASALPTNSVLQFVSLSGASENYWLDFELQGNAYYCSTRFSCDPVEGCDEVPNPYVLSVTVSCGDNFLEPDELGISLNWDGYDGIYYVADVSYDVAELFDGVEGCPATADADEQYMAFELGQNWPNPFNPVTSISFQLPETQHVRLGVYNLFGERVALLADGLMESGSHQISFDGSNLASGIYVYALQAGNRTITKRMTLIK